jgi:hypothetical protein
MRVTNAHLRLLVDLLLLAGQRRLRADYGHLRSAQSLDPSVLLSPRDEWPVVTAELTALMQCNHAGPLVSGGLNSGDRRAVHSMIRALKPASVLEVGTHIGSSTIHIAAALRANAKEGSLAS